MLLTFKIMNKNSTVNVMQSKPIKTQRRKREQNDHQNRNTQMSYNVYYVK